jgi:hypothetical protein
VKNSHVVSCKLTVEHVGPFLHESENSMNRVIRQCRPHVLHPAKPQGNGCDKRLVRIFPGPLVLCIIALPEVRQSPTH